MMIEVDGMGDPWVSYFQLKWGFPKMGVPKNGWLTMENPMKIIEKRVPP
jgi:hypothetical protein